MTNQEAIHIIENVNANTNCDNCFYKYDTTCEDCRVETALNLAIEALEKTKWFPVSETLPEENGCYLVTTTGTNNDIIDIAYYTNGIWHKASRIKAWIPLPAPYREESAELKGENK